MVSDWQEIRMSDVFETDNSRLGEHDEEPTVFSISKYDGVIPADEFFGKRVASAKLDTYKVLPADGWAYSTIHIDEGSIARNTRGSQGVVSPMYTTLRWIGDRHDPVFFEMLLREPAMLETYRSNAQGSINRRRSLPWKSFADIQVTVPGLPGQRRIVDLIGSLDEAIDAADDAHAAQKSTLDRILDQELRGGDKPLGELATVRSGASWAAEDSSSSARPGSRPVLTIVNTRPDGSVVLDERTYVKGLSDKATTITSGSLVMIRTNGNRARIGNVYRSTPEVVGDSVSAFQFVIEPVASMDRDFLYWSLRAPSRQAQISDAASGSTGLGNVAAGWLKAMEVAWPDEVERESSTAFFESFNESVEAAACLTSSLRTLRSNLLTTLLSGSHEIPESYDALNGVAA